MKRCQEMNKLRQALDKLNIHWVDHSTTKGMLPMERTYFTYNNIIYSVIHGFGSMGGYSSEHADEGLLEIMEHTNEEVKGHLTAEEVLLFIGLSDHTIKHALTAGE